MSELRVNNIFSMTKGNLSLSEASLEALGRPTRNRSGQTATE